MNDGIAGIGNSYASSQRIDHGFSATLGKTKVIVLDKEGFLVVLPGQIGEIMGSTKRASRRTR